MIERYQDQNLNALWADVARLQGWQATELAGLNAHAQLGRIPQDVAEAITAKLSETPIDTEEFHRLDRLLHHDLNASLAERTAHLPEEQRGAYHLGMTSYDTEEPAWSKLLDASVELVLQAAERLDAELVAKALAYRYTPLVGRTHGQWGEFESFGKRNLCWLAELRADVRMVKLVRDSVLCFSKMSGAIGSYTGVSPEWERVALGKLGLQPFYGATQIMPRSLFFPVASSVVAVLGAVANIAIDIRLGARSGCPLYHEPFDTNQMGSSAMPHKRNTINDENTTGMYIIGVGCLTSIAQTLTTWEERDIAASSVERTSWLDLFHAAISPLLLIRE